MEKINELKNCTPIKTILMLIIVLYHSMIIYAGGSWGPCTRATDAPILGYIAEWMNSFHIYAFTLISGYIFYYIKYENGGYQKYLPFLKNKALRLLVPYMFAAAVCVAPYPEAEEPPVVPPPYFVVSEFSDDEPPPPPATITLA